jgi:hypothetical protein
MKNVDFNIDVCVVMSVIGVLSSFIILKKRQKRKYKIKAANLTKKKKRRGW